LKKFTKPEEKKLEVSAGNTFDIEVLKTSLPDGVPASEKERYLAPE